MTREEAITKYILPAVHHHWNEKICDEIEQMLKQEPCEDCISREVVKHLVKQSCLDLSNLNATNIMLDKIAELPCVEPSRPHGEWTVYDHGYGLIYLKCSLCDKTYQQGRAEYNYNFCPNCGADMRGGSK